MKYEYNFKTSEGRIIEVRKEGDILIKVDYAFDNDLGKYKATLRMVLPTDEHYDYLHPVVQNPKVEVFGEPLNKEWGSLEDLGELIGIINPDRECYITLTGENLEQLRRSTHRYILAEVEKLRRIAAPQLPKGMPREEFEIPLGELYLKANDEKKGLVVFPINIEVGIKALVEYAQDSAKITIKLPTDESSIFLHPMFTSSCEVLEESLHSEWGSYCKSNVMYREKSITVSDDNPERLQKTAWKRIFNEVAKLQEIVAPRAMRELPREEFTIPLE